MSIPYVRPENYTTNLDSTPQQITSIHPHVIQQDKLTANSSIQVSADSRIVEPIDLTSSISDSTKPEISNIIHTLKNNSSISIEQITASEVSPKKKKQSPPSPLTLPKRFIITNQDNKVQKQQENINQLSNKESQDQNQNQNQSRQPLKSQQNHIPNQEMPYLQSFGPQYPLQYIPSYYPMQINQQTGSLNTLPISAPPYPISTQPLQYQNQLQQQQQQQQQQVMFVQPRPQQIVYARTANGQLIPLLVQQPQSFNNLGMVVPSQVHNNDTITNNDVTVKNDDTPNKRQKTAKLTENELIQNAENLQRQHILRQMQMHPNLNKELQIPNISDVFHTNCNSETSATSTSGNENIETEEVIDNELEIKAENDHDQVENIKSINYSLISNNLEKSSDKNTQSPPSLQKKPQKIIGTVTLGTFTYQYSQTLSGDLTRDKELFDRLSDNAWKTCISKR